MVRKRVILLGLTLGLIVNQFMLWQCNKVISAPNYSYTNVEDLSNCQKIFNGKCLDNTSSNIISQNNNYSREYVQSGGYQIDTNEISKRQAEDEILRRTAIYGGGTAYSGNSAQNYIDNQRQMYNATIANRAGVPYEEYVCKGNFQCIQQMYMNEQQIRAMNNYANAVRNQNVNINGSLDVYHNVNRNGYYYRY